MSKRIILLGGAPTTGKSTIAKALAQHFNLPWISTDQIRNTMRVTASRESHPNLFNPEGYNAERFLTEFSAEQIVAMELAQGEAAWAGIKAFIEEDYTWDDGFVIEGVNILPHLVAKDFSQDDDISAVFVVDHDIERMRKVIYERGLWDDADKYPDSLKEKEVEWVTLFNQRLEDEAKRHDYPLIEVHKNSDDVNRIISVLSAK